MKFLLIGIKKGIDYKTSRDYTHLKELLDEGKTVIGFTTYDFNRRYKGEENYKPIMVTDICKVKLFDADTDDKYYSFGVRGNGYGDYEPKYHEFSFEEFCKILDFEYIEPDK